jgi:hypothetical protein
MHRLRGRAVTAARVSAVTPWSLSADMSDSEQTPLDAVNFMQ